jgi:hypothetical protein
MLCSESLKMLQKAYGESTLYFILSRACEWSSSSHHQPINAPTAGAQAFLMDHPQGERAITHHAGPVRVVSGKKRLELIEM